MLDCFYVPKGPILQVHILKVLRFDKFEKGNPCSRTAGIRHKSEGYTLHCLEPFHSDFGLS